MDLLKWLARWLPEDPDPEAGYWIFRLPKRMDWAASCFRFHDRMYLEGPKQDPPMQLADIDSRVFNALVAAANTEPDPIKRCQRFKDITRYWRIMRVVGRLLYRRHSG